MRIKIRYSPASRFKDKNIKYRVGQNLHRSVFLPFFVIDTVQTRV